MIEDALAEQQSLEGTTISLARRDNFLELHSYAYRRSGPIPMMSPNFSIQMEVTIIYGSLFMWGL